MKLFFFYSVSKILRHKKAGTYWSADANWIQFFAYICDREYLVYTVTSVDKQLSGLLYSLIIVYSCQPEIIRNCILKIQWNSTLNLILSVQCISRGSNFSTVVFWNAIGTL